jgi:hypothetical protein
MHGAYNLNRCAAVEVGMWEEVSSAQAIDSCQQHMR